MANVLKVGGTVYEVVFKGEFSYSLKGPRGGEYSLVQNVNNPKYWAFSRKNSRVATTSWFYQVPGGNFVHVAE